MAKAFYVGDNNDVARKVKAPYAELGGVARAIIEGYIGVNDIARKTFRKDRPSGWFTFYDNLTFNPDPILGIDNPMLDFPFTTLDGLSYERIKTYDTWDAYNFKMYFVKSIANDVGWEYNSDDLVYSQSTFWNDGTGWGNISNKSIYLDNLVLGEDISEETYALLLTFAYPDDSISGKPQTYFLKAGNYQFNGTLSSGSFPLNPNSPAVDITVPFYSNAINGIRIKYYYYMDTIDDHELYYISSDGTQTNVYSKGVYEGQTGWQGAYNYITLQADAQVAKSAYDWWAINTTIGDTGGGDTGGDTEDNYNSFWIQLVDASTGSILSNVYTKHSSVHESYVEIHEYAILPEHPEGAGTGSTSHFDKKISYASLFLNGTEKVYPGDIIYVYGDTIVYVYFEN